MANLLASCSVVGADEEKQDIAVEGRFGAFLLQLILKIVVRIASD
jgi:hypothetical protein